MIAQLVKKDALVIEMNQFRTSVPLAAANISQCRREKGRTLWSPYRSSSDKSILFLQRP